MNLILKSKILSEILKTHRYSPPVKINKYNIPIVNETDSFTIKLEIDKHYKKSFLWRIPALTNKIYGNYTIEDYVKDAQKLLMQQKVVFLPIVNDEEMYLFEVFCSMKFGTILNLFETH